MKRTVRLLALALMLALIPIGAFAAPGDAVLMTAEPGESLDLNYSCSIAVVGDVLYILREGVSLSAYRVGDEGPTVLVDSMPWDAAVKPAKLIGGDELWAIDGDNHSLWRFDPGALAFERRTDLDPNAMTFDYQGFHIISSIDAPVFFEGAVYLRVQNPDSFTSDFCRIDVDTGRVEKFAVQNVSAIVPFAPDMLLLGIGEGVVWSLSEFNTATGQAKKKWDLAAQYGDLFGLQYDRDTKMIYLARGNEILRSEDFSIPKGVAFLPGSVGHNNTLSALLPGGYYVVGFADALSVLNTDPAYKPTRTLRLDAWLDSDQLIQRFIRDRPDIVVEFVDAPNSGRMEDLVLNMSGPNRLDIYAVGSHMDFQLLARKGYVADLSGSDIIAAQIQRMYPDIQELITADGKIFAVPDAYRATSYAYNLRNFRRSD